ncbi:MAG: SDR family oxidoreductase [Dehalococcoidia bacterium]
MVVTLVTGASTGIGRACAIHFARRGDRVYATMRNPAAGADLAQLATDESIDLRVVQLDVNDQASVDACMATVTGESGAVDVLINNAGVGAGGAIEETDLAEFRDVMETNYFGALRMIKAVVPAMRARRSGAIVNVTSVAGRVVCSPQGAYAASKYTLEALSEALAQEMRRFGVRVHIVEPGVVLTPIFAKNMTEPDMSSPSVDFALRLGDLFMKRLQDPSPPELAAEVIDDALSAPEPKLRHVVGWDGDYLIAGRARVTDEEWVDYGLPLSEAELGALWREKFHMNPADFTPLPVS